jgi:NAD(P)-dependent dehydrogenase (short-subunit alcohol dehydrogenase family)
MSQNATAVTAEPVASVPDLVVVTGAGRGIGKAIAIALGRLNVKVLCLSQSEACLATAALIRSEGGSADGIPVNLADLPTAEQTTAAWLQLQEGKRTGVVLAAGVLGPSGSLADTRLEEWDEAWRINVLGNLAVVKGALPRLTDNRHGRLLFFGGGGAAYAYPLFPAYAASKAALVRIVENLHEDLKAKGDFAVCVVAPGAVDTDMLAAVRSHGGYVRTTVDIAEPVGFATAFLSSTHCAFSGCFVHVRDTWPSLLDAGAVLASPDLWKLRRTE